MRCAGEGGSCRGARGREWRGRGRSSAPTYEDRLRLALGELDMAPELLRGGAGHIAAVVLEDQGVAARRHDEELRDHGSRLNADGAGVSQCLGCFDARRLESLSAQ